jgi:Domain of unknown function (DUF222)
MRQASQPTSAHDALVSASAALSGLAHADATELTTAEQADCLRALERAQAQLVAARSAVLAAFTHTRGFEDDAAGGSRSWLRWQTRVTTATAADAIGWMERLDAHPAVASAMAAGDVSGSWARKICWWSDRLPEDGRAQADAILLAATAGGAHLRDLAGLAEQMYHMTAKPDTDDSRDGFDSRNVHLLTHFRGAGKLDGDLTPECAAALRAVLDSLSAKAGPEDIRTAAQREHDALAEACRRLIAGGLPDRAGQPTQIQLHMTLEQLLGLNGAGEATADWAGFGATATPGSDCDASISPIVTAHVDPAALAEQASPAQASPAQDSVGYDVTPMDRRTCRICNSATAAAPGDPCDLHGRTAAMAHTAARDLVLSRAIRLLSGPGGLAAHLRTGLLPQPAASISLPLDIGKPTEVVPPHLRRAVIARDKHCAFPGCDQRPAACHVHHLTPRSEGGLTSLDNCCLLCSFHHLIAVHTWGWQLHLHPDGTTSATSPGGQRTLHSHAPPTAA